MSGNHNDMGSLKTVADLVDAGNQVLNLLPKRMAEVTNLDAEYHAGVRDEWVELNQVDTERNKKFHEEALDELAAGLATTTVILELGSGVGYDAKRFLDRDVSFGCYIISEISPKLLDYARNNMGTVRAQGFVRYCCLDANHLLIADDQIDRLFAVATVHHFPHLDSALSEIDRVTKRGAKIIFAIEPNRLWSSLLVLCRPLYRRLFASKSHSAADEEAEGFRRHDLETIGEKLNWTVQRIVPVWFFTGFMHLGMESLYRILRLKRRMRVPAIIEKMLLSLDALLFRVPYFDRLAWHYTVVFTK
jgi:ubiquinone/menaquinone biosynthesis C-methylase UbiE